MLKNFKTSRHYLYPISLTSTVEIVCKSLEKNHSFVKIQSFGCLPSHDQQKYNVNAIVISKVTSTKKLNYQFMKWAQNYVLIFVNVLHFMICQNLSLK